MFTIHSCFSSPISAFSLVKWLFMLYFYPHVPIELFGFLLSALQRSLYTLNTRLCWTRGALLPPHCSFHPLYKALLWAVRRLLHCSWHTAGVRRVYPRVTTGFDASQEPSFFEATVPALVWVLPLSLQARFWPVFLHRPVPTSLEHPDLLWVS